MSKQPNKESSLLERLERFNRENTKLKYEKPDYDFWRKNDYWELGEAVFLISGIEPVHSDIQSKHFKDYYYWDKTSKKLKRIYDLAKRSIVAKKLKGHPTLGAIINPEEFATWAHNKGLPIPDELKDLIKGDQFINSQTDSKKTTKSFPQKALDLGVEVWPELQLLHDVMKTNTGFAQKSQSAEERKEDALSYIEMHPDKCPIISKYKHILKGDLFILNNSHNWRIVAKILRELLIEKEIGTFDYQKIYKAVKNQF